MQRGAWNVGVSAAILRLGLWRPGDNLNAGGDRRHGGFRYPSLVDSWKADRGHFSCCFLGGARLGTFRGSSVPRSRRVKSFSGLFCPDGSSDYRSADRSDIGRLRSGRRSRFKAKSGISALVLIALSETGVGFWLRDHAAPGIQRVNCWVGRWLCSPGNGVGAVLRWGRLHVLIMRRIQFRVRIDCRHIGCPRYVGRGRGGRFSRSTSRDPGLYEKYSHHHVQDGHYPNDTQCRDGPWPASLSMPRVAIIARHVVSEEGVHLNAPVAPFLWTRLPLVQMTDLGLVVPALYRK
jgi:hypothetical protein